jgi:Subtilase family/GEVED domain/Secretion system C-terminal sorting domain
VSSFLNTPRLPFMKYLLLSILLFMSVATIAQTPLYSNARLAMIATMAQSIENQSKINLSALISLAQKNNWPIHQRFSDGTVMQLAGVSETGEPIYDITTNNILAAATTRTNSLYIGGGLGLNLTGGSAAMKNRLATWDGGKVLDTHREFGERIIQADNATTLDNHATHTSGTMIAAGINPNAKGMAFGATLQAYDFNNDNSEIAAASAGLLVSNHSYGTIAGWRLNTDRVGTDVNLKWEWYGDSTINDKEDYKFGFYDSKAKEWDKIAYAAPTYLMVKSAGNDHSAGGPAVGTVYFIGSSAKTSKTERSKQTGYDQIPMYGTAKNILTVGAISALANGYNVIADPKIASFSGWGPTDDGRIKPDIVADGVSVLSTSSANTSAYASLSGTSMSTPNTSGTLFLLQELYNNTKSGFMRAATLKGLAIHTADDGGNVGPDYIYGWGVLNAKRAAEVILNRDATSLIDERTLNPNETYSTQVVASGKGNLIVTICWTDPDAAATIASAANYNNRTPKLINDLDLRITDGITETQPYILNPDNPSALATRGDNIRDNVEQILIPNTVPGKTYTVTVKHKKSLTNSRQDYALIMSGIGGKVYCDSKPLSNADSKITKTVLGNTTLTGPNGCQSYSDFTDKITTISSGQAVPIEVTVGSCGADLNKIVKVFIDWNNNGSFDDTNELIGTSGILANGGVLSTNIIAPTGLTIGNLSRVRVVCVETNQATSVSSCGSYSKGETQEFLVQIVQPNRDMAIVELLNPANDFCSNQSNNLTVRVRNIGLDTQSNIPVSVQVQDSTGLVVGNVSGTITQNVASFAYATLSLTANFLNQLQTNTKYSFVCKVNLANDQDATNNQLTVKRTTASPTPAPTATATFCGSDPVSLINQGTGTAFWYDALNGGNVLAAGNQTSSSLKPADNTFFVAQNTFAGSLGLATKSVFGGGSYSGNFGPAPLIKTEVPLIIESARLYIGNAGKLTFTVLGLDDSFVSSVTLDVQPTRNTNAPATGAPTGQLADDPNDIGAVYALNLAIPKAGDYKITIGYENGASIFRSNVGVTGFPYKIPNILTLRASLFDTGTKIDTLTSGYYYFYDLKVKSLGCPGRRVAVLATTASKNAPAITTSSPPLLCAGSSIKINATPNAGSYQWFLNGQSLKDANGQSLLATSDGDYTVSASSNNCLPSLSNVLTIGKQPNVKPIVSVSGITLTSNITSGNQWLLNGTVIPNATGQTFVAVETGRYSVRANTTGCGNVFSDEVTITITALELPQNVGGIRVKIYPNPASQYVVCEYVTSNLTVNQIKISLIDVTGRLLSSQIVNKENNTFRTEFKIDSLQNGTIFAVFSTDDTSETVVKRLVKQ